MEDPQQYSQPPATDGADKPLDSRPPKKRRAIIMTVIGVVLIALGVILWLVQGDSKPTEPKHEQTAAEKVFYDMASTAASKSTIHFTYAEQKFASSQARDAKTPTSDAYSVAELDDAAQDFRAVYAKRLGSAQLPYYDVGRCLNDKLFAPEILLTIKSLGIAQQTLQHPFGELTTDNAQRDENCQLDSPHRAARLTDGIIPIGLSPSQITTWRQHLEASKFLVIKDEGRTTYKGAQVRKIHLTTNSIAGASSFYESGQSGAGLELTVQQSDEPGADAYRLDDIPTSDNIDGFYLIDEATKLPVYSEFTTAALLNNKEGYVFKQAYGYPESLSLGAESTIDTLE